MYLGSGIIRYNADGRDDSAEVKDLKSLKEEVPALLIEMSTIKSLSGNGGRHVMQTIDIDWMDRVISI